MLCAASYVVMVPDFTRALSMPARATMFPAGTDPTDNKPDTVGNFTLKLNRIVSDWSV